MEQLILLSLELRAFQKFDYKKVEFGVNQTDIIGDNGVGKTTIYSSFTWLLFGKDSLGREKFEIKHLVNGKKQDKVTTSVVGRFIRMVNGVQTELVLERALVEKWNDKTDTYIGDETKCYVNGVPKLVGEYQSFVSSIINESEFRMLTSVNYFLSMKKEEQREYLCRMAGVRSPFDVAKDNALWTKALKNMPDNITIEDYQKSVKDSLKAYKDEKKGIQPSIDALTQSMPEECDWSALEDKKSKISAEIDSINASISSKEEQFAGVLAKKKALRDEIAEADTELIRLEMLYKNKSMQSINTEIEEAKKNNEAVALTRKKLETIRLQIEDRKREQADYKAKVERYDLALTEVFNRYELEEAKVFEESEELHCPLAKHILCVNPGVKEKFENDKNALRAEFNSKKVERLSAIQEEGRVLNIMYKKLKKNLADVTAELAMFEEEEKQKSEALAGMRTIDINAMQFKSDHLKDEQYQIEKAEIMARRQDYEEQLALMSADNVDTEELKAQRTEAMARLENVIGTLALKAQRTRMSASIEEIKQKGVRISDKITEFENLLETLMEIQRAVIDDASKRINSMFQITKWITTEQLKNGNYRDICEPTVNGVSISLNTASRINVGLDICSAISRYLGIYVPCFIEARESVNDIVDMGNTQIINLRVAPKGTPFTVITQ